MKKGIREKRSRRVDAGVAYMHARCSARVFIRGTNVFASAVEVTCVRGIAPTIVSAPGARVPSVPALAFARV